jgi:hypothetical protein
LPDGGRVFVDGCEARPERGEPAGAPPPRCALSLIPEGPGLPAKAFCTLLACSLNEELGAAETCDRLKNCVPALPRMVD